MKKLLLTASVTLLTAPAWAGTVTAPPQVPEMGAGPAIAAVALLVGAAAIIRERAKRK
ncbi:MAG: hypothetical protein DHS20C05_14510 [Hyphococcus sp.]|nr:MAG: hypothetical protein DHS20C05_14510 [Marinicaulis sp.]